MNLTPLVEKDKIFIFYMLAFFCCRMMHDYFNFFKEGRGATHKARLIVNPASHTINLQADVRLHDILYFICFAF